MLETRPAGDDDDDDDDEKAASRLPTRPYLPTRP